MTNLVGWAGLAPQLFHDKAEPLPSVQDNFLGYLSCITNYSRNPTLHTIHITEKIPSLCTLLIDP